MGTGIVAFFRELFNAKRISDNVAVGRIDDNRGIHRFASRRAQAISDCSRVSLLAKTLQTQRGGDSNRRKSDSLRELIRVAKSSRLWIDDTDVASFGEVLSKRTGESLVYWNSAETAFYKIKNPEAKRPIKRTSDGDWVYEHVIHNILFPETAYEFIGISVIDGELRVVLKQKGVLSETFPTKRQIRRALAERGLFKEDRYFYGDGVVSVTDVGESGDNVLVDDAGLICFVDPLIRLRRSAPAVIEWLTGFNPENMRTGV